MAFGIGYSVQSEVPVASFYRAWRRVHDKACELLGRYN